MNNFYSNFSMSNLIYNDVSAVQPRGEPTKHSNSNHNQFTRLSHEMKTPVIAHFKVQDITDLPAKFSTCYHADQIPRKILEKRRGKN